MKYIFFMYIYFIYVSFHLAVSFASLSRQHLQGSSKCIVKSKHCWFLTLY